MISLFCNHIIFSFPFFARIGSIEVFFVSYLLLWLLFFYLLEVCTGRDWRLEILSFYTYFYSRLYQLGKGQEGTVIPFVQAHVGSLLCLQYKHLIVHVKQ